MAFAPVHDVILLPAGGLREAVGEAAVLVDPRDVNGWSGALEDVLASPARRASLRERGLRHARRFRWEETAQKILTIIQEAHSAR